jgi:hypothetical protein
MLGVYIGKNGVKPRSRVRRWPLKKKEGKGRANMASVKFIAVKPH